MVSISKAEDLQGRDPVAVLGFDYIVYGHAPTSFRTREPHPHRQFWQLRLFTSLKSWSISAWRSPPPYDSPFCYVLSGGARQRTRGHATLKTPMDPGDTPRPFLFGTRLDICRKNPTGIIIRYNKNYVFID